PLLPVYAGIAPAITVEGRERLAQLLVAAVGPDLDRSDLGADHGRDLREREAVEPVQLDDRALVLGQLRERPANAVTGIALGRIGCRHAGLLARAELERGFGLSGAPAVVLS